MKTELNNQVAQLGSILGIWAHPDDELFLSGGLLAAAAENGQQVACVTATKGEAGIQDEAKWPAEKLAEIREQELMRSYGILGLRTHHWLGYPDGGCHDVPQDEAVSRVAELIRRYRPDTVLTFPPDGITGHYDHQAVSLWTCLAAAEAKFSGKVYFCVDTKESHDLFMRELDKQVNVYFNVDEPALVSRNDCDVLFELSDECLQKKIEALRAMPSQTSGMLSLFEDERFQTVLRREQLVLASRDELSWNKTYWQ
jgi:LmbE family N-acetylglucosaminyl deacetylase